MAKIVSIKVMTKFSNFNLSWKMFVIDTRNCAFGYIMT